MKSAKMTKWEWIKQQAKSEERALELEPYLRQVATDWAGNITVSVSPEGAPTKNNYGIEIPSGASYCHMNNQYANKYFYWLDGILFSLGASDNRTYRVN